MVPVDSQAYDFLLMFSSDLEKCLNLNLANFEILHLLTILKQALVCMITNKLMTAICHLLLSLQYW